MFKFSPRTSAHKPAQVVTDRKAFADKVHRQLMDPSTEIQIDTNGVAVIHGTDVIARVAPNGSRPVRLNIQLRKPRGS